MNLSRIADGTIRLYREETLTLGVFCQNCSTKKREVTKTPTSIHGACLDCGYQKCHSKTRHSQVWHRRQREEV